MASCSGVGIGSSNDETHCFSRDHEECHSSCRGESSFDQHESCQCTTGSTRIGPFGGFELSPVLWRKVKPSLSAGRVQSVAVRLIVEREREIIAFQSKDYYNVVAEFVVDTLEGPSTAFRAELNKRFATEKEAEAF